jgi:hypothetical protein
MNNNNTKQSEFSYNLLWSYVYYLMFNTEYNKPDNFWDSKFYKLYIKPYAPLFYYRRPALLTDEYYALALQHAISINVVPSHILDEIREWSISNL